MSSWTFKTFTLSFLFQVAVLKLPTQNLSHQEWVSFFAFYQMMNVVSCGMCHEKVCKIWNFIRLEKPEQICEESWSDIRKQLREIAHSDAVNKTVDNIPHTNKSFYGLAKKLLCEEKHNFLWWRGFKALFSSHRRRLRRSVPSSSLEPRLQRRRCQSCKTASTTTWAGQEVS